MHFDFWVKFGNIFFCFKICVCEARLRKSAANALSWMKSAIDSMAIQTAQTTNSGNLASGPAGHRGGGRGRGERPDFHTVFVPTGEDAEAKLQSVQIKTGISDGISTEVISGLEEGARVVTGVVSTSAPAAAPANPFGGGGFPRR